MSSTGSSDQVNPTDVETFYRDFCEPEMKRARRDPDKEDIIQNMTVRRLIRGSNASPITNPQSYVRRTIKLGRIDQSKLKSTNHCSLDQLTNNECERPPKELVNPRRNPEMQAQLNEENEQYRRMLTIASRGLNPREKALLALHLQGYSNDEIARRYNEHVSAIRHDMNAVLMRIRYRLKHLLRKDDPPST